MTDIYPLAISIADAVRMVGLGRTSLYAAIGSGKLRTRLAGRRRLIEVAELRQFVASLPASNDTQNAA
jgi:hypothetical protein